MRWRSDNSIGSGPIAALLLVQLLFGSMPVIGKVVLAHIPSVSLVGIRVVIAAVVLAGIQAFRQRFFLQRRSDYIRFAVLSLFGVVLNQLLFIGGLARTRASNTALLAVTIPIFTLMVGALAGSEKLQRAKLSGVMLAAIGVIFLIDPRRASFSSESTVGDLMIIANSLSFGIFVATSKETITRNGAVRSTMWLFIFASIACAPLGLYGFSMTSLETVPAHVWPLTLYIGVFATALPYLLNSFAISRVSPSIVAVIVYLQPVIGFLLAVVFLNERVDLRFALASIFIFAGLYLTTKNAAADSVNPDSIVAKI